MAFHKQIRNPSPLNLGVCNLDRVLIKLLTSTFQCAKRPRLMSLTCQGSWSHNDGLEGDWLSKKEFCSRHRERHEANLAGGGGNERNPMFTGSLFFECRQDNNV